MDVLHLTLYEGHFQTNTDVILYKLARMNLCFAMFVTYWCSSGLVCIITFKNEYSWF